MSLWSRVRSWFGSGTKDAEVGELAQPKPDPVPDRPPLAFKRGDPMFEGFAMSTHAGRNLNPARLLAAYDMAELGDPREQCDIFEDRIEVDAHLRSLLETRVDAVARKPWVVQEGGDAPADRTAARLLEERLRLVPNFIETLEHQLRFNWYGYSATEIDWALVDGFISPTWFENVAPQSFRFDPATDEPFLLTTRNIGLGEPLLAGRWWFTARTGRRTAATGYMRTAAWWSMFKGFGVRDWMVWARRFGIPSVHGKHADDATPEDIAALKKAAQNLGRDGWAVFNDA